MSTQTTPKNEWILDSGASDHYTCNKNALTNMTQLNEPRIIKTANGMSSCEYVGDVCIDIDQSSSSSTISSQFDTLRLTDVLYVPDFHVNLVRMSRIEKTGARFVVGGGKAEIRRGGVVQLVFPHIDNLYIIKSTHKKTHEQSQQ